MAYTYLLDLYKLIDQRLEDANLSMGEPANDPKGKRFHEGRIKALLDFKNYLTQIMNPKLPRRIRQNYDTQN